MKPLTITIGFISLEIVLGTLFGQLYIKTYDFWTSDQSLDQFLLTTLLIYLSTVIALGTINLSAIRSLTRDMVVRCFTISLAFAVIVAVPILYLPADVPAFGLSPFVYVLLALITGFNLPIVKKVRQKN